jgi:uncharacterized membrane protein (UPF0127 family)
MLFVFAQPQRVQFWMKDMKFNLDFVWLRNLQIVQLTENVPAPATGTPTTSLPTFSADQPVDMVLEMPQGSIQKLKLKVGGTLKWTEPE